MYTASISLVALTIIASRVYCQYGSGYPSKPVYRVLSVPQRTPDYLQVQPPGSDPPYTGLIWDMLNALKGVANFDFTLSIQADGVYGAQDANGKWNGMVGQLIANNTDIVAADFGMSAARQRAIDFTTPYTPFHVIIVTPVNTTPETLSSLKYAVRDNSVPATYLQTSSESQAQSIWASIQANKPASLTVDDAGCLALALQGGWACIAEDTNVQAKLANVTANPGLLKIQNNILMRSYYGLGVQLGSPLRRMLSIAIDTIIENGIMANILAKYGLTNTFI